MNILLKLPLEYRFQPVSRSFAVGLDVGFQYYRFNGDDIQDNSGNLNLYVDQTNMAILGGGYAKLMIPGVKQLMATVGVDVLGLSFVSEGPSNTTGTDPKGKLGFMPALQASWVPSERHHFDAGYHLRLQKFDFSGTGSRVGTSNVTDGNVESAVHFVFLKYNFLF